MFRQAGLTALWFTTMVCLVTKHTESGHFSRIVLMNMPSYVVDGRGCCWPHCVKALQGLKNFCGAYAEHETTSNAQDEEMRALQRDSSLSLQRAADLRERLNFQCFKYELLVDMVCVPCSHELSSSCSLQLQHPDVCSTNALQSTQAVNESTQDNCIIIHVQHKQALPQKALRGRDDMIM